MGTGPKAGRCEVRMPFYRRGVYTCTIVDDAIPAAYRFLPCFVVRCGLNQSYDGTKVSALLSVSPIVREFRVKPDEHVRSVRLPYLGLLSAHSSREAGEAENGAS